MTFPTKFQLIIPVPDSASVKTSFKCPFGALGALVEGRTILSVDYLSLNYSEEGKTEVRPEENEVVDELERQFSAYFLDPGAARFEELRKRLCPSMLSLRERFCKVRPPSGERRKKRAQMRVEVCKIGFGKTRTYGQIAAPIHSSGMAVGAMCRISPFSIVVPCFRVVSQQGRGGFAGNELMPHDKELATKHWLLDFERVHRD